MEDAKLTGLLVSIFYEGSVFHEALQQRQNSQTIQSFLTFVLNLIREKCASRSELEVVSIRNRIENTANLPHGYCKVAEAIFTYLLNIPCFIAWEGNLGDYLLTIPIPAALPIDFVRASELLDIYIESSLLRKAPSPALVVHLLRQGRAKVFPSLEIKLESNLNGHEDGRKVYVLQTVICLTSENDLVTYTREGNNNSDTKWKVIKQREWNHFRMHDLPNFEKQMRFINNLRNLEYIPIEIMAMHSIFMMETCLFLIYVPIQSKDTLSEALACTRLDDEPDSQVSSSENEMTQPSNPNETNTPFALEVLDSILSLLKSYSATFAPIIQGLKDKLGENAGINASSLTASSLAGYIDLTYITSLLHPQFYIVWNKLTQFALGTGQFELNADCILLHEDGASDFTIQHLYNNHDRPQVNNPVRLTFALKRSCTEVQAKLVGIDTQILTDASDKTQSLKLIYVMCFVEGEGMIAYMFDAVEKLWKKKLSNGNVENLERLTNVDGFLEFAQTEDTLTVQQHSIGIVYALLEDSSVQATQEST